MQTYCMNQFLVALVLLLACLTYANGQQTDLASLKQPPPMSLMTMARYFVYASYVQKNKKEVQYSEFDTEYFEENFPGVSYITRVPPLGWGLWDLHNPVLSSARLSGVSFAASNVSDPSQTLSPYELGIMEYEDFWDIFIPFQKKQHFCCTEADVTEKKCVEANRLLLPTELTSRTHVHTVPYAGGGVEPLTTSIPITKSGIHFLVMVNCGATSVSGTFTGTATVSGVHGYLSGIDVPKLELYALGTMIYAGFFGLWAAICFRHRRQLLFLHILITLVIVVGLLEQMVWYLILSVSNKYTNASTALTGLGVAISVLRNVFSIDLMLIAALGYCTTRPSLEGSTWRKIGVLTLFFVVFDGLRQVATQFHVSFELSFTILLICALPITLFYSSVISWSLVSLNSIIKELKSRRQLAKLSQLTKYRATLIFAVSMFILSTTVETIVMTADIQRVWPYEWVFTDAIPNLLFFVVLGVMVILWRPTRSSKYYSYIMEVPDSEFIGNGAIEIDRIRADVTTKTFEMTFSDPRSTDGSDNIRHEGYEGGMGGSRGRGDQGAVPVLSVSHPNPVASDVRVWGELDLDLEDESLEPVHLEK